MPQLYSNPNAPRRTMNLSAVRAGGLKGLMNAKERRAHDKARRVTHVQIALLQSLSNNEMASLLRHNSALRKARRLHRKNPRIPKKVKKLMAQLGLKPPR